LARLFALFYSFFVIFYFLSLFLLSDLAARNVLLRTPKDSKSKIPQCVLVDMGLARLFDTDGDYVKTKSAIPVRHFFFVVMFLCFFFFFFFIDLFFSFGFS
jgi:hypothetical protein